jgi:hypothetical protein
VSSILSPKVAEEDMRRSWFSTGYARPTVTKQSAYEGAVQQDGEASLSGAAAAGQNASIFKRTRSICDL